MNSTNGLNSSPIVGITSSRITSTDATMSDEWRAYDGPGRYKSVPRVSPATSRRDSTVELNPRDSRRHIPRADVEPSRVKRLNPWKRFIKWLAAEHCAQPCSVCNRVVPYFNMVRFSSDERSSPHPVCRDCCKILAI
jgi:hypothetical protein